MQPLHTYIHTYKFRGSATPTFIHTYIHTYIQIQGQCDPYVTIECGARATTAEKKEEKNEAGGVVDKVKKELGGVKKELGGGGFFGFRFGGKDKQTAEGKKQEQSVRRRRDKIDKTTVGLCVCDFVFVSVYICVCICMYIYIYRHRSYRYMREREET